MPFYLHGLRDTDAMTNMIRQVSSKRIELCVQLHCGHNNIQFNTNFYLQVREVGARFEERGLPNYPAGIPFLFWEQYLNLRGNLGLALAAALAAVALTVLIILLNIWAAILIALSLAGCALQTLGLLGLLGIPLSAVTAVLSVLGVGIAAQPCLHVTLVSYCSPLINCLFLMWIKYLL